MVAAPRRKALENRRFPAATCEERTRDAGAGLVSRPQSV